MDKLTIHRGLTRYSSEGWKVRLFVSASGCRMRRLDAPETRHSGLFLPLGAGSAPQVIDRYMPLFGDEMEFPDTSSGGALFLTTSEDDLDRDDLLSLSSRVFGAPLRAPAAPNDARVAECERMFLAVMRDAYHQAA